MIKSKMIFTLICCLVLASFMPMTSMAFAAPKPAPKNIAAQAAGYKSINLSWDPVVMPGFNSYQVYRSTLPKSLKWSLVATTVNTKLTDINLITGSKYYYKVRAIATIKNLTSYGAYSKMVSAVPVPSNPNVRLDVNSGQNSLTITWTPVPGASGYEVARTTNGSYSTLATTNSTSYTDTKSIYYMYKVRAYTNVYRFADGVRRIIRVYGSYSDAVGMLVPPELNADGNDIPIETIELEHESINRVP